jgi:hypothetical protein
MTFDEAIATKGRKFQAWGGEVKDGKRAAMIYRLDPDGALQLAWKHIPEDEHEAVVADLLARGIALAAFDFFGNLLWIPKGDGIEVYSSRRLVLTAADGHATLEDGRVVSRADIVKVIAFADPDYVYRGVKAALKSGKQVPLVTMVSGAAEGDPTYSRNELLQETGWAITLGTLIAAWAGAPFEDLI